jgi:hypothetical protein
MRRFQFSYFGKESLARQRGLDSEKPGQCSLVEAVRDTAMRQQGLLLGSDNHADCVGVVEEGRFAKCISTEQQPSANHIDNSHGKRPQELLKTGLAPPLIGREYQ